MLVWEFYGIYHERKKKLTLTVTIVYVLVSEVTNNNIYATKPNRNILFVRFFRKTYQFRNKLYFFILFIINKLVQW